MLQDDLRPVFLEVNNSPEVASFDAAGADTSGALVTALERRTYPEI